jgi:hypothetical protein
MTEFNTTQHTTETKVVVSLHLHHAPQEVMLVCKLEILSTYSSSEEPAHLNMQPHKWGSVQMMYWQMTLIWWLF